MGLEDWVLSVMEKLGYLGIAFLMFLDNIFPPIPSEIIMPSAGYTASKGDLTLIGVIDAVKASTASADYIPPSVQEALSSISSLRDAERDRQFEEFKDKVGESLLEVGIRVEKLIKKFKNKKVLISSHGGTIKAGVTKLLNLPDIKAASGLTIPNNLGLSTLVCQNNQYQLWSYNVGEIGYENFTYNK